MRKWIQVVAVLAGSAISADALACAMRIAPPVAQAAPAEGPEPIVAAPPVSLDLLFADIDGAAKAEAPAPAPAPAPIVKPTEATEAVAPVVLPES